MNDVLLLSTTQLPVPDVETASVVEFLAASGVSAGIVPWDEAHRYEGAKLAVIRSTWDYFERLPQFHRALAALTCPLANSLTVVKWNSHKGYLIELDAAGVPTIPTQLVRAGDAAAAIQIADEGEVVIKPAVSAGAIGTGRYHATDPAALAHLRSLVGTQDALIQPFIPEVITGESSILFFGGEYSHSVLKMPAAEDFRVQQQYGGMTRPYQPGDAELAVAQAAIAHVPEDLLYARVDLVTTGAGPVVMELELIEPELFLPHAPGATERFAQAIMDRL